MNTRKLFLLLTACLGLTAVAAAQTQTTDATVSKVSGSATVTLADGSMKSLKTGDKIPQGATITTGADGDLYLQTHASTTAILKANTTVSVEELSVTADSGKVTEEKTMLNLKSGNLISVLDPSKKKVNNYNVRTPKGVAAARGTSFSVSVSAGGFQIAATADAVTFTNPAGAVFTISSGMISITLPGGEPQPPISLSQAAATNPAIAQVVADAVTAISTVVQAGNISAEGAVNVASQVVAVASTVSPATAAAVAAQVSTAAATSASPTIAAASASTAASVASAAATAAPSEATNIAREVVAASSSTNTQAAATVAAAVAQAVPAQATTIAAAVAQTVATASGGSDVQVAATVAAAVSQASNTSLATVAAATAASTNTNATAVTNVAGNTATQTAARDATASATTATQTATQATQNIVSQPTTTTVTPPAPTTETPPAPKTETTPQPPATTTPQPIDPSTVSRSG